MKSTLTNLSFILLFLSACTHKKENQVNAMLATDVPKFIAVLPSLSRTDMKLAFQQANVTLKYGHVVDTSQKGQLEAATDPKQGQLPIDGELILSATPLISKKFNEFAISLKFQPVLDDTTLLKLAEKYLNHYKRQDLDGVPTWNIKGWYLQVKSGSTLEYRNPSQRIPDALQPDSL